MGRIVRPSPSRRPSAALRPSEHKASSFDVGPMAPSRCLACGDGGQVPLGYWVYHVVKGPSGLEWYRTYRVNRVAEIGPSQAPSLRDRPRPGKGPTLLSVIIFGFGCALLCSGLSLMVSALAMTMLTIPFIISLLVQILVVMRGIDRRLASTKAKVRADA